MTDLQFLVLALTILYLSECLYWVRRGSVVFRQWFPGTSGAAIAHPSPGLGTHRTGFILAHPLPPFGNAFVAHQWPVSMTPEAACSHVAAVINGNDRPDSLGACLKWDDMWKIDRDGEVIFVNNKPFARCNFEPLARIMEKRMQHLHAAPMPERPRELERSVHSSFSIRRIHRDLQRFHLVSRSRGLRWNAHLLLLVIFVLIPCAIGLTSVRPFLLSAVVLLLALLMIQAIAFFLAHRRLYPDAPGARWRGALTMIFTPTASIRACDLLARDLFAAYQPLALAMVLCRPPTQRTLARRTLLDLIHPMEPMCFNQDPLAQSTTAEFHQFLLRASTRLLEQQGFDIAELTAPPTLQDPKARSFCPRCDGEFLIDSGVCEHCGGIPLQAVITAQ